MEQTPTLFQLFYESSGICTDTRKIEKNCLFICIKGDNFDGNKFAEDALAKGALHVIVDNPEYFKEGTKMSLVEDSVKYIQDLASYHRDKFDIPVIGITGSNGKTTTKELINAVLSKKHNVLATIGNLNNHLGVPFTLLRLTGEHDIAIIEMGANHPGEIAELCAIAKPNFGIITNIGKAHLEGFKSFQGVLETKSAMYHAVRVARGKIFVNGDDSVLIKALDSYDNVFTYGMNAENEVTGELSKLTPFVEMTWTLGNYSSPLIHTQLVGKYNFYNFMAAISFGVEFNVDTELINEALEEYTPSNNRSQVKKTEKNTLLLDCYNANPTSMQSALQSFALIDHPYKLAILGDMKELGEDSLEEHKKIIELTKELGIQTITVGEDFAHVNSSGEHYLNTKELQEILHNHPRNGELILLKGSRSIGLEVLENEL